MKSEKEKNPKCLYSKDYLIKEDNIDFKNELIKFENIEIEKGMIKIFIYINQKIIESNDNSIPNCFTLILDDIKSIKEYQDFSWLIVNNLKMRIKIKITTNDENISNINHSKPIIPNNKGSLINKLNIFNRNKKSGLNSERYSKDTGPKKLIVSQNINTSIGEINKTKDKNERKNNKNEIGENEDIQNRSYDNVNNQNLEDIEINNIKRNITQNPQNEINNNFLSTNNSKKGKEKRKSSDIQNVLMSLKNPKSTYEQDKKEKKQGKVPIKIKKKMSLTENIKGALKKMVGSISPFAKRIKGSDDPNKSQENCEEKKKEEKINISIKDKTNFYDRKNFSTDTRKLKNKLKDKYKISNNLEQNPLSEIYSKEEEYYNKEYCKVDSINYSEFLKKLNEEKKTIERETFCEGFFITSFPTIKGEVIENSQSFKSSCGHTKCSTFPAMKPEIIFRYPLNDTKNLELNNLAATICFPTGIKVCYSEEPPTNMIDDYLTSITNQKGERYYMMTYHFYQKINNNEYSSNYEMHPLKHQLMTFGDSYMTLNDEGFTEKIIKKVQETLELCQELGFREYVYVPFCLCIISKYPYAYEMSRCLQSIFNVMSEEQIISYTKTNFKINDLIMYLTNSVPIPIEKLTRVKFYLPFFDKGITLKYPKLDEINLVNINYLQLIELFSIDNVIIILRLLLLEKKILFIDDDYTRLSEVTDAFISLIYPFKWIHTYIPIMSDQMLKYLESFLPFLNGIHLSLMPLVSQVFNNSEIDDNEDVFLIFIKEGKINLSSSLINKKKKLSKYIQTNLPNLPINSEKKLKNKLSEINDLYHNNMKKSVRRNSKTLRPVDPSQYDISIRIAFIQMFVDMFKDYPKYMCILDNDVVFNKNSFLDTINKNDKQFFDEFLDTQLFQQFSQIIFTDKCNYFNKIINKNIQQNNELEGKSFEIKTEKIYVIPPIYLGTNEKENNEIENYISLYYPTNLESNFLSKNIYKDDNGIILPSYRVIPSIKDILDEDYINDNCLIYLLPNQKFVSEKKSIQRDSSVKILETIKNTDVNIEELGGIKKTFTSVNFNEELTEKNKEEIKERIKDYLRKIFQSENIDYNDPKIKTELLNLLKKQFGREIFINLLSSNSQNIVLLQLNSFKFLGFLIYNVLVETLQVAETDKLLEEVYLLIKSTMYYGIDNKGKTQTLFKGIKSKIRNYPKITQKNFWNIWFENEIKIKKSSGDSTKQIIILNICSKMIELEISKTIIKNIIDDLNNKAFGENSEMGNQTQKMYIKKITETKYLSKAKINY